MQFFQVSCAQDSERAKRPRFAWYNPSMVTSDWIALGVGGYAALVATVALAWNIIREIGRIEISVGAIDMTDEDNPSFAVHIINRRHRQVNIGSIGLIFTNGVQFGLDKADLNIPGEIPGEDRCTFYLDIKEIKETIKKLEGSAEFAYVEEATGRLYKTRIPRVIRRMINDRTLPSIKQF